MSENRDADPAIEVEHVTMRFRRARDEASSLKEYLVRAIRRGHRYEMFTALDDVNLSIGKGEVVGIIGTNGSGKSTLLKIISGALIPTAGKVWVDRKKVQLLTLGTGFDLELTGRENVYLNGAIIGYTKSFIDAKYREIVRFAELEGFMEEKVRNYSSGMISRLGFAIATAQDTPEILILDEATQGIDVEAKTQIYHIMDELAKKGKSILFISSDLSEVMGISDRILTMRHGRVVNITDGKKADKDQILWEATVGNKEE